MIKLSDMKSVNNDQTAPNDTHTTVSEYLQSLNNKLEGIDARIIGEVCNLKLYNDRSYMYFSIKDKNGGSVLNCFMWKAAYRLCGVVLEDGMEVVIYGYPKIYEPNGSLAFQTKTVELVGEGALKKAYEKLKLKLEKEGLLKEERKRQIPDYPQRIGIITSKSGAVLADFTSNIGRFGFEIKFVNSRVEGQIAVEDLLKSVETLAAQNIDILVIMRGGGSLESFMAFNNEALARAIANFPVPVIAGIGHDKDICLVSLVADKMVSTPTAVAQLLNKSWEQALSRLALSEKDMINGYERIISDRKYDLERSSQTIGSRFASIFDHFRDIRTSFEVGMGVLGYRIREIRNNLSESLKQVDAGFERMVEYITHLLGLREKEMTLFNPENLLNRGYSIVRCRGKIINDIKSLGTGEILDIKMMNGVAETEVIKITVT